MASWSMKRGFFGWRIAHTRRTVTRIMKSKIRIPAKILRKILRRLWPWLPQSLADMVVAKTVERVVW